MSFSDELTRARERFHLSKHALAAESGVSYKHIDNLEAGRRPITLPILHKLHRRLKFPERVLLAVANGTCTCLRRASAFLLVLLGL